MEICGVAKYDVFTFLNTHNDVAVVKPLPPLASCDSSLPTTGPKENAA